MIRTLAAGALVLAALAGCAHAPPSVPATAAVDPGPPSQARWEAGQKAYEAWSAARPGWTTTASGLQWRRVKRASAKSPHPKPDDVVTIHYTGTFIDGVKFDSSRDRGEPATFPLNRLIQGWQEGVPLMRVGERFEFVIPADIAYGARTRPPIHPNSTLLFDIELVAIGEEP